MIDNFEDMPIEEVRSILAEEGIEGKASFERAKAMISMHQYTVEALNVMTTAITDLAANKYRQGYDKEITDQSELVSVINLLDNVLDRFVKRITDLEGSHER